MFLIQCGRHINFRYFRYCKLSCPLNLSTLQQVAELFPLEPTLLFHASFGIAVANSIVFLGATLKDRKLMTLRQWLLLQVVVLVG